MEKQKRNDVAALLRYAGGHKGLTFLGLALSGLAMLLSMAPYICIWLAARDLIAASPISLSRNSPCTCPYFHYQSSFFFSNSRR